MTKSAPGRELAAGDTHSTSCSEIHRPRVVACARPPKRQSTAEPTRRQHRHVHATSRLGSRLPAQGFAFGTRACGRTVHCAAPGVARPFSALAPTAAGGAFFFRGRDARGSAARLTQTKVAGTVPSSQKRQRFCARAEDVLPRRAPSSRRAPPSRAGRPRCRMAPNCTCASTANVKSRPSVNPHHRRRRAGGARAAAQRNAAPRARRRRDAARAGAWHAITQLSRSARRRCRLRTGSATASAARSCFRDRDQAAARRPRRAA